MKKTLASRLLAVAMMSCTILTLALPVSSVNFEKYIPLTLEIKEANETGADGITKVTLKNEGIKDSESLTDALIILLVGNGEIDKNELWNFESDNMAEIVVAGMLAYSKSDEDGGEAWDTWLDTFASKSEITGDKSDLVMMLKGDKTVGDLEVNTPYVLQYEPADADVDPDDYAYRNLYTFTMIAGGSDDEPPEIPETPSTPDNPGSSGGPGGYDTPDTPDTPDTSKDVVIDVPQAATPGNVVTLPVDAVKVGEDTKVVVSTKSETPVRVEIPVVEATAGTVAVIIKEDGTEQIIRDSFITENGIVAAVSDGDKIVIKDNTKTFNDVTDAHWGKDAVTFVAARGLFAGTGNDTFSPNQTTNRAMVVQVLHNLEYNQAHSIDNDFHDVGDHHWYDNAVSWAAEKKIVSGYDDGSFRGDKNISRQELVVMLWNYAGKQISKVGDHMISFNDADKVAVWAKDAMNWALENGILSGKDGKMLDPIGMATRAELAQMMKNFCQHK